MSLKENVLLTFPKRRGHSMPCGATWEASGSCQEEGAKARRKPRSESSLGFL